MPCQLPVERLIISGRIFVVLDSMRYKKSWDDLKIPLAPQQGPP
jgi:hypothetical protein